MLKFYYINVLNSGTNPKSEPTLKSPQSWAFVSRSVKSAMVLYYDSLGN